MGPLLLLILASPTLEVTELPAPEPVSPRASVYFSPVAMGGMLALGTVGPGGLYLPVGGVLSLGPHWGITAEAAVGVPFIVAGRMMNPGWSLSAAVGPTYFQRDQGTDGFFVTAKLQFQVSKPMTGLAVAEKGDSGEPLPIEFDTSYTFLIGGDVGYQWHVRRVTIATVLGGSIGYGYHRAEMVVTPFDWESTRRSQGTAFAVNVDLLRIGYAF
ncbi:MAG: hypothetical protein QM723_17425 [Myxococcaceae bacterium]